MADEQRGAAALRASAGLFRALFEQSPLSVQVLAPTGETLAVNRAWEALWGVTLADLPGYNLLADPQLEANGVAPLLRRAFAGERVEIPAAAYVPDRGAHQGAARWVRAVASPVRDEAGGVAQVVLVHEDVTDLVAAERALRALAEAGRAFAEAHPDPSALLDAVARHASAAVGDGCAVWLLEEGGARLHPTALHHPDPEVLADARAFFAGVVHGPDRGLVGRVARTGEAVLLPEIDSAALADRLHPAYRAHLERHPAHGLLAAPMRARGAVVGVVALSRDAPGRPYSADDLALLRELADRAALALDNARLHAEARAAEARHRGVFAGVADAVLVADAEGRYLDANPAALALLGYGREELLRLRVPDVVARRPAWTEAEYARFRAEGRWRGELELRRKDGSTVPVEAVASAVELRDGPLYLSAVRDVSERRALARLQEDFLAMVGHDLRTPLTAVKGQAQLMRRRRAYSERGVEAILAQVGRMDRLVGDLADVARLEAGRLRLARAPVDLAELAREGAEQARLLSARHAVRVDAPGSPVVAVGDRDRLGQVLQNLLGNALKYSPAGGEVAVAVWVEDGEARLSVADRGVGVAPDRLPRLFDRFYRAHEPGAPAGLGLGLYITRMLVEAHGGRVWAASEPGRGSIFTVALPAAS